VAFAVGEREQHVKNDGAERKQVLGGAVDRCHRLRCMTVIKIIT
jgi:hypothetical protein